MKSIFTLTIVLCFLMALVSTQEDEVVRKPNPLLRRPAARNIYAKTSTTTLAPEPPNEEDYEENDGEEEFIEDDGQSPEKSQPISATEATTEAAKKIGPIIRPFRSNDDLLNALKKRQQDVKSGKKVIPRVQITESENTQYESSSSATLAPQTKTIEKGGGRKRFGNGRSIPVPQEEQKVEDLSTPTPRPARSRFSFNKSIRN